MGARARRIGGSDVICTKKRGSLLLCLRSAVHDCATNEREMLSEIFRKKKKREKVNASEKQNIIQLEHGLLL